MPVYATCRVCGKKLKMGSIIPDVCTPSVVKQIKKVEDCISVPECCGKQMILEEKQQ